MAANDKDVHQKGKAIRFCLATGLIPFYEVNVNNVRELSDAPELLTDIDVLGVRFDRGRHQRTLFDCKTGNKNSPINRAFWAAGLMKYARAEEAYVILKKAASEGHKLSAKSLRVHLYDEALFDDHATALSTGYLEGKASYAGDLDLWHALHAALRENPQLAKLGDHLRHFVPLENDFAKALRGIVAHVKQIKGELDPARSSHRAIFSYSVFALAFAIGPIVRDFFDVFDPKQKKDVFEKFLRTYVWGGREAYHLRKKLYELMAAQNEHVVAEVELSGWDEFVEMTRAFLDAPDEIPNCCSPLIGITLRYFTEPGPERDRPLALTFLKSNRVRQFCFRLSTYLVVASGLPKEFDQRLREDINAVIETQ